MLAFIDIALQVVESLNVYQPDFPTLTPVPSPEFIQNSIERESVRRIFWLIHLMSMMKGIFFKHPAGSLGEQGTRLRLPADETSFELGVHSTLPGEFALVNLALATTRMLWLPFAFTTETRSNMILSTSHINLRYK
jgi:hypothetical protein